MQAQLDVPDSRDGDTVSLTKRTSHISKPLGFSNRPATPACSSPVYLEQDACLLKKNWASETLITRSEIETTTPNISKVGRETQFNHSLETLASFHLDNWHRATVIFCPRITMLPSASRNVTRTVFWWSRMSLGHSCHKSGAKKNRNVHWGSQGRDKFVLCFFGSCSCSSALHGTLQNYLCCQLSDLSFIYIMMWLFYDGM